MPGLPNAEQSVVAKIHYVQRPADGQPLETFLYELPEGKTRPSNVDHEEFDTKITDLRTVSKELTLERNGFKLAKLLVPKDINWQDEAEVRSSLDETDLGPIYRVLKLCLVEQLQTDTSLTSCRRSSAYTIQGLRSCCSERPAPPACTYLTTHCGTGLPRRPSKRFFHLRIRTNVSLVTHVAQSLCKIRLCCCGGGFLVFS